MNGSRTGVGAATSEPAKTLTPGTAVAHRSMRPLAAVIGSPPATMSSGFSASDVNVNSVPIFMRCCGAVAASSVVSSARYASRSFMAVAATYAGAVIDVFAVVRASVRATARGPYPNVVNASSVRA